ncbi:thaumatin-like protein 1 [Zingiber officinale]|uniref:thaumatin-like protein 1 n=1 Tax=Zingiber officinale TaxID=94328 RepID=UPI001C4CFD94|nr:thaumatin-like protein 1 [Zingiber officinale]
MGTLVSLGSFCLVRFAVRLLLLMFRGAEASTFTFVNKCGQTVWPGILSNAGSPALESTGFELPAASSRAFQPPTGWSGRFWARTGCSAAASGGAWSCATGDCGSGQVECNGAGAAPPATLAEFTLAPSSAGQDFYDVSLVDGYNLPMVVEASGTPGAGGSCAATGCVADLNRMCPAELRVAEGEACRSACEAFGTPEFCCSGAYASPATCRPSTYSQMFKSACPRSYSYAFDDPTSTFTCAGGADYTITFCPGSAPSQKSSRDSSTSSTTTASSTYSGTGGGLTLEDDSWLASLATGDASHATTARGPVPFLYSFIAAMALACTLLQ